MTQSCESVRQSTRQPTAQTELPNAVLILNKNRTTLATKRKLQKLEHNLPTEFVIDSGKKCMAEDANSETLIMLFDEHYLV